MKMLSFATKFQSILFFFVEIYIAIAAGFVRDPKRLSIVIMQIQFSEMFFTIPIFPGGYLMVQNA
jgi:hypothetical protein